ncbi:hypothetical protein BRN40_03990, partial [Xanthomonas oryzae pv. oryzae]
MRSVYRASSPPPKHLSQCQLPTLPIVGSSSSSAALRCRVVIAGTRLDNWRANGPAKPAAACWWWCPHCRA